MIIGSNKYTKDPSLPPDGIVVTLGMSMVNMHGGLLSFTKYFEAEMQANDNFWIHKMRGQPQFDIAFVYCIIGGHVKYKLYYGGYSKEPITIKRAKGHGVYATWPHILLGGPLEMAPYKIPMKGFQGFRYCTKLF